MADRAFDEWFRDTFIKTCQVCGETSATVNVPEGYSVALCYDCWKKGQKEMNCEVCNRVIDSKVGFFSSSAGKVCFACLNSLCVGAKTNDSLELEQLRRNLKLALEEKENIRNTWAKKYDDDIRDLEAEKNTWEAAAETGWKVALENHDELIELRAAASEREYAEQKLKEEIEELHNTVDELGPEVAMLETIKLQQEGVIVSLGDTIRNQEAVIKELREKYNNLFQGLLETARRL